MTVHLDTSALIDALTGPRRSLDRLIGLAEEGHRLSISAIVLYEWLRGPRSHEELAAQEELFPRGTAVPFGAEQAASPPGCMAAHSAAAGGKSTSQSPRALSKTTRRSGR